MTLVTSALIGLLGVLLGVAGTVGVAFFVVSRANAAVALRRKRETER
jgi:hypothetical protein